MRFDSKGDKESVGFAVRYLKSKGFDAKRSQDDMSHYDIEASKDGRRYHIEVKYRRGINSADYGDIVIDKYKIDFLRNERKEGKIDGAYVISLYEDCFFVTDAINERYGLLEKEAAVSTDYGDGGTRSHLLSVFKQKARREYE